MPLAAILAKSAATSSDPGYPSSSWPDEQGCLGRNGPYVTPLTHHFAPSDMRNLPAAVGRIGEVLWDGMPSIMWSNLSEVSILKNSIEKGRETYVESLVLSGERTHLKG